MPYILKQDRQVYFSIIDEVLQALPHTNDPLEQAEYVGYFLFGVVRGFYKWRRKAPTSLDVCPVSEGVSVANDRMN